MSNLELFFMNKSEKFGFDCIVLWGLCGESWVVFVGIMKLMYKEESSVAVYEKE